MQAAKPTLGPEQAMVLRMLADCEPGKGIPLAKPYQRLAKALIGKGYVMSLGFGSFHVFIATDKGRALASQVSA